MKELDKHADYLIRECLGAKERDGVYSAAKDLFGLPDRGVENSRDTYLWRAEEYGLGRTKESVVYYHVTDRALFFKRLAELYGQDAITNWLLDNEGL